MEIKKSCLIIFIIAISLAIDETNADWKFWKRNRASSTTETSVLETPSTLSTPPPRPPPPSTTTRSIGSTEKTPPPRPPLPSTTARAIVSSEKTPPPRPLPPSTTARTAPLTEKTLPPRPPPPSTTPRTIASSEKTPPPRPLPPSTTPRTIPTERATSPPKPSRPSLASTTRPSTEKTTPSRLPPPSTTPRTIPTERATSPPKPSRPSLTSTARPSTGKVAPPISPRPSLTSTARPSTISSVVSTSTTTTPRTTKNQGLPSNANNNKGNTVTDADLQELSEILFSEDKNNAWQYITLNLQKKTTSQSQVDEAPQPLLTVKEEALRIPTIDKVLKIYDNYHVDTMVPEHISPLQRDEESSLVDAFLTTKVMTKAMQFLAQKGFMEPDYYEYKFILRKIWFSLYSRGQGKIGSSGFEHVFMGESRNGMSALGIHNWIYFNIEESNRHLNYLGYNSKVDLGNKAAIVKFHTQFHGINKPVTAMFVGTSPELEMALYTVCFFTRPEQPCRVKLGGTNVNIVTHKMRYRGKDLIGTAYPEI